MYKEIKVIITIKDKDYFFDFNNMITPFQDVDSVPKVKSDQLNKIVEMLKNYEYSIRVVEV